MSQEPTAKVIRLYCDAELPAQEHAELELRLVTVTIAGLVGMLQEGAVHLGLAQDSRNWLQRYLEDHPEVVFAANIASTIATLGMIIFGG